MTAHFKTKRPDGLSQWRVVYDHVTGHTKPGDVIAYSALETLLGTNNRADIYPAVAAANRRLWRGAQRSLQVSRNSGYRVLLATEHEFQASGYQVSARKKLGQAVAVMGAVDLAAMSPTQRNWALKVAAGLTLMANAIDTQSARLAKHDAIIQTLQDRIDALEQSPKGEPPKG